MKYSFFYVLFLSASMYLALPTISEAISNSVATIQQPLLSHPARPATSAHISQHLDPRPNTVGLALTTAGTNGVIHVWVPIGQRISPRDWPVLPSHPSTARIISLIINATPADTQELLQRVVCVVHPTKKLTHRKLHQTRKECSDLNGGLAVSFQKSDRTVDFTNQSGRWWIANAEVDSYECY
ncbi:hypothetical protein LTR66_013284 [Elasticomyces elasticus]|nr:hypothetical protein LTR66_013284 [Elasticomyces elasticus]